jgi:hypothetical protein
MIVDRRFRGVQCLQQSSLTLAAVRTSDTSVDKHFTRQYIPEDNSEHHTRRRENLKSHIFKLELNKSSESLDVSPVQI